LSRYDATRLRSRGCRTRSRGPSPGR
jgi:hypothetical protein